MLKHAFEGKLTSQWREENKNNLEPPAQLLARIKQERKVRCEQKLKERKAAVSEDAIASLPLLPDGWLWIKVQTLLAEPPTNGRSVKGRASRLSSIAPDRHQEREA